ncbi:MAG: cobyrinate a,c-diamide synthase [Nitrospirae bacterium]|nr:cobyrinate a,c-diamide synthase [Nitrospirota bacterium]
MLLESRCPRVVFAALGGGSGKTTVSLGVAAALAGRGKTVIPFKKGPDFIDPGWLSSAAGSLCFNLDPYLMPQSVIAESFVRRSINADVAVIEGNRGLYDGVNVDGAYSTAELAKQLGAPVILIIDTTKMTRTVAAIVMGCQKFDPDVRIAGVVLNRVGSARQERLIRSAVLKYCGIPVVGAIPRLKDGGFPERHMGLTPADEHPMMQAAIASARDTAEKYMDIDAIMRIASIVEPLCVDAPDQAIVRDGDGLRIGIVRDTAFQFYYPENVMLLEERGVQVISVNALSGKALPKLDALYIGGGFPETHAPILAENEAFRMSLSDAAEDGLPIYAECGGLMYLGRSITVDGVRYPMAGVLPLDFMLSGRPKGHGYTDVVVDFDTPFFPAGTRLHGHEFHYSSVAQDCIGSLPTTFTLERGTGVWNMRDGVVYKNVLAAYTHLHALGSPEWVDGMIRAARNNLNRCNTRNV